MNREGASLLKEPPMHSEKSEEEPVRKASNAYLAVEKESGTNPKNSPKASLESVLETPKKNVDLERLKGQIDGTESIDELCETLSSAPELAGSSENVVASIRDVETFLEKHINEIITGEINKGAESCRRLLKKKFSAVKDNGRLAIKAKVEKLLRARLNESFKEKKADYVVEAVAKCDSFEQLYGVIRQLKGVNIDKADKRKPRYSSEQAIRVIEIAMHDFDLIIKDLKVLNGPDEIIDKNIEDLIKNLPKDSGINEAVGYLLKKRFKEARLEKNSGSGFIAGVKKLFGKRKK